VIQLYQAGGAGDFTILQDALTHEQCRLLFENAGRVLTARTEPRATELLRTVPFRLADATNHFNDEFSMLHAVVSLEQYEQLRRGQACFSNPRWRRAIMKLMVAGKAPATVQYILMLLGGRPKNVVEVQSDTQPSVRDQFAEQLLDGMTPDQIASVADDARRRLLERATGVALPQDDGPPV